MEKPMYSFVEKERQCERAFENAGPFWHLCTDGTKMENIFTCNDDMKKGMISLAKSKCMTPGIDIITFEFMINHVHIILSGGRSECMQLFKTFKKNLIRVLGSSKKGINWTLFDAQLLEIPDIKALRNEIIYTHRNAFVANPQYTPFNYPWGGGWTYFTPMIQLIPLTSYCQVTNKQKRLLTYSRPNEAYNILTFIGDTVFIPSFCNIELGESMYQDARSYFNSMSRNSEAYSLIAERLKDSIFLTDDEIYLVARKYSEDHFNCKQLKLLSPEQKIQTASQLHFKYKASNQQIRRILNLNSDILNELFP